MGYSYESLRSGIFTDEGQRRFLRIRDHVEKLLGMSGAATMWKAIEGDSGDDWERMACVDRMVELGELSEVPLSRPVAGQDRVFVRGNR